MPATSVLEPDGEAILNCHPPIALIIYLAAPRRYKIGQKPGEPIETKEAVFWHRAGTDGPGATAWIAERAGKVQKVERVEGVQRLSVVGPFVLQPRGRRIPGIPTLIPSER
ncbi:hypothetical protein F4779DRAFT_620045 [Xylariaceae sp. FL0662B]|nr:hypothetical protein F4779DRAFT_620045 [Xylariaceae sp. FL0662B]